MTLSALPRGVSGYGGWPTAVADSDYGGEILLSTVPTTPVPNVGDKTGYLLLRSAGRGRDARRRRNRPRAAPLGEGTRGGLSTGFHSTSAAFRCLRGLGTSRRGPGWFLQQETWDIPASALSPGGSGATLGGHRKSLFGGVLRCPQHRGQAAGVRGPRSGVILQVLNVVATGGASAERPEVIRKQFWTRKIEMVGPLFAVPPAHHAGASRVRVPAEWSNFCLEE